MMSPLPSLLKSANLRHGAYSYRSDTSSCRVPSPLFSMYCGRSAPLRPANARSGLRRVEVTERDDVGLRHAGPPSLKTDAIPLHVGEGVIAFADQHADAAEVWLAGRSFGLPVTISGFAVAVHVGDRYRTRCDDRYNSGVRDETSSLGHFVTTVVTFSSVMWVAAPPHSLLAC